MTKEKYVIYPNINKGRMLDFYTKKEISLVRIKFNNLIDKNKDFILVNPIDQLTIVDFTRYSIPAILYNKEKLLNYLHPSLHEEFIDIYNELSNIDKKYNRINRYLNKMNYYTIPVKYMDSLFPGCPYDKYLPMCSEITTKTRESDRFLDEEAYHVVLRKNKKLIELLREQVLLNSIL